MAGCCRVILRTELITKDEIMIHLREEGIGDIAEVEQACMDPDGMISVIRKGGESVLPSHDRTFGFW